MSIVLVNPYSVAVVVGLGWDATNVGANIVLSNSNRTATNPVGSSGGVRGITSHNGSGKYYFEVVMNTVTTNYPQMGVCITSYGINNGVGYYVPGAWAIVPNGAGAPTAYGNGLPHSSGAAAIVAGQVWACAVDLATGKIWWALNNTWTNGGNPSAGTGAEFSSVSGTILPFGQCADITGMTAHFSASDFTYTPPTGFGPW